MKFAHSKNRKDAYYDFFGDLIGEAYGRVLDCANRYDYDITKVAQETGLSRGTIYNWFHDLGMVKVDGRWTLKDDYDQGP